MPSETDVAPKAICGTSINGMGLEISGLGAPSVLIVLYAEMDKNERKCNVNYLENGFPNIFCLEKQCSCRAIPVQCLPWLSRNVCSTYLRTLHNTRLSFPQLESSSSSPLLSSSLSSSFCRALDCSF